MAPSREKRQCRKHSRVLSVIQREDAADVRQRRAGGVDVPLLDEGTEVRPGPPLFAGRQRHGRQQLQLRDLGPCLAVSHPAYIAVATRKTTAHNPNTTSTSPRKWSTSTRTLGRHRSADCACLLIVTVLHPVCETSDACRRKRVENRQDKHSCGDGIEGLDLNPHREIGRKRLIRGGRVTLQRARKFGCRARLLSHHGALP